VECADHGRRRAKDRAEGDWGHARLVDVQHVEMQLPERPVHPREDPWRRAEIGNRAVRGDGDGAAHGNEPPGSRQPPPIDPPPPEHDAYRRQDPRGVAATLKLVGKVLDVRVDAARYGP
jgi:hypothetical protein